MDRKFWHYFAIGFLAVNTLCAIILLEMVIYSRLYVTAFLLLFSFLIYLNHKHLFKPKKLS